MTACLNEAASHRAAALAHADADDLAKWYLYRRHPPGPGAFTRLRDLLRHARLAYAGSRSARVRFKWGDASFVVSCTAYGALMVRCATTGRTICSGGAGRWG